jgi:hypothetical protein
VITAEIQWIDRPYPLPKKVTPGTCGAQEITLTLTNTVAAYGHQVADLVYIEETAADPSGRILYGGGTRAFRAEFTANGRRVVIRHDSETAFADPWTLTVDGQPVDLSGTYRRMLPERLPALAYAVHRAVRRSGPQAA